MCIIVQFSVRENLLVVTGNPETKELKDMMPEILKQVGPQQYQFLKDAIKNIIPESKAGEEDEDDVPELVGGNFEDASKK
jgi:nascent polypeptide-associated complex subunit beta